MTNHPHRQHDEDEPTAEEMLAGAVEPLAAEMRDKLGIPEPGDVPPQGSAEVPAHTGNGVPPGLRGGTAKVAAEAVAEALGQHLPQMMFQAVAAALQQVPVRTITQERMCATCIVNRIGWENLHRAELEAAMDAAALAAGVQPGTQQAAQLDLAAFLPQGLRPGERGGLPGVSQSATTWQGTECCPMHIPGVQAAGRSPLVVATAGMSPAMLAQFAGVR